MLKFKETINEVLTNRVAPRHGIADDHQLNIRELTKKGYHPVRSSSGKHTLYSKIEEPSPFDSHQIANHFWVNNKTKKLDFHVRASTKASKEPGERLYHAIDTAGRVGGKMGHHAYFDLMSGRTGHAAIMVHDNMSKGAIKLQQRIRKTYGDKVIYHQYDPSSGEAKHHTHGVSSSFGIAMPGEKITPYRLHAKIGKIQVVGMVPKKHRYQHSVQEATKVLLGK